MKKLALRSHFARRCSIETLEDRRLMAGDVFARIDRGNLIIRGDDADNGIQILGGITPGEVRVLGTQVFGIPTRVNGVEGAAVTLTGFNGRIDIVLNGGSDRVRIESFTSRGITADLGRGIENMFEAYNHTVTGDLFVKSLEGNDIVIMNGNTVNGSLTFDVGEGVNSFKSTGGSVGRDARFLAGRGTDVFDIASLTVGGNLVANLGDGQNSFSGFSLQANRVDYRGGRNVDSVYCESGDFNWVTVDVGQGDNKVDLHGPRIRRDLRITAGSGNDEVIGDENFVDGSATIILGDGNNSLHFQMHVRGDLTVCSGRGLDNVDLDGQFVDGPVIYRSLKVDLGDGANTLDMNEAGTKGNADVRTGKDADLFNWTNVSFGSLLVNMGSGENQFNANTIAVACDFCLIGTKGNDRVEIFPATFSGKTNIDLGDGANRLDFGNAEVRGDFVFRTGAGFDNFIVSNVHFLKSFKADVGSGINFLSLSGVTVDGWADFKGGVNDDEFQFLFSHFARLNVDAGRGNDKFVVAGVVTTQKASFNGGDGNDTYLDTIEDPNTFAGLDRRNIETFGKTILA